MPHHRHALCANRRAGLFGLLALLAGLTLLGRSLTPVRAAFPGSNGKIVFTSNRDSNDEIYVMNADGSNQTRLTNNTALDDAPAWSPDGTKIAFHSARDGNQEIYVMNADGSNQTRLTNDPAYDFEPGWSPDGTQIVFASSRGGDNEIYVMNADGSGQTPLTSNTAGDGQPVWSPDGLKIAFISDRDVDYEVYVMNSDGSGQTNLSNNGAHDYWPGWSPDGTQIAFNTSRDSDFEIYAMNSDGSGQTNQSNSNLGDDLHPAWSPDGTRIAFESSRDGNNEIYVMNADGSGQTRLTNGLASDFAPDWQPAARLTIVKAVAGSGAPADWSFDFTGDLGSFSLTDDDPNVSDDAVVPGTVNVSETNPGGYETTIDCDSGDSTFNGNLSLTLDPGDDVTCTVTNDICQSGYYDTATGWHCIPSDPGYFVDTFGASQQTPCPPGFYQSYPDQGSCDAARPGHYATGPAATEEVECSPGTYQPNQASVTCNLADAGYYAEGPRATDQEQCPPDTTSPLGSDSIDDCYTIVSPASFFSPATAGTTADGVPFGGEDILRWQAGGGWSVAFDGSDAGLTPTGKWKHNINAFAFHPLDGTLMAFAQNARVVPGIGPKVDGMDLVYWDGSSFSLYFDGQDVGLTNKTQEKIDGLHALPGSASPIGGGSCVIYLLISTQGPGKVSNYSGGTLNFSGEDVLGFCATNLGDTTTGLWTIVLDGSQQDMPKNSTDSLGMSADGQTLYLMTNGTFNVDAASGGHSMVYAYDIAAQTFSGPVFVAPAEGLPAKVDGLEY